MIRCIVSALVFGGSLASVGCDLYGIPVSTSSMFRAQFSGDAERPDPVDTDATGSGTFSLNVDETELTYEITASGLSGDVTAAHFHFSVNGASGFGDVVHNITDTIINDGAGGVTAQGTWDLSSEDVRNLRLGYIYVNLHTEEHPPGEIRGNLEPES